jgi:hypothetical protein
VSAAGPVFGRGGSRAVREALAGDAARRQLAGTVGAMLEPGWTVGSCSLYRAKLKPGRKLSGWYRIELRDAAGRRCERHVAAAWLAGGPPEDDGVARVEAEASERGLAAPFHRLERWDATAGLLLRVAPLDARLPVLPALSDAHWAGRTLATPVVQVSTVRYRPGERHVLAYRSADDGTWYAKLHRDGLGPGGADRLAALERWIAAARGISTAPAAAVLPAEEAVIHRAVEGAPPRPAPEGVDAIGRALAAFHRAPRSLLAAGLRPLPVELASVARAAQHVDVLLPEAAHALHAALDRAQEVSDHLPAEPVVSIHGDCKLDHFITQRAGIAVIDLDRCRPGHAAADLGKLLADLRWRAAGRVPLTAALVAGHAAAGGRADPRRVQLYDAVFTLKAAARRIPLWSRDWEAVTWSLVRAAERTLTAVEAGSPPVRAVG